MRTAIKYTLSIILVFIFAVSGLFFPEWMAAYTDQNIIGKVGLKTVDFTDMMSDKETRMISKMRLLRDYPQNVDRITLETGKNFDFTSAGDRFFEEVTELTKIGLLPEINSGDKTTLKMDVSLYVQKDEPSTSGMFWSITLQTDEFSGNFYMDDHTGKIIQFIVNTPDKILLIEKKAIQVWAEYLGLVAQNIESEPVSYPTREDESTKVKITESHYTVYNFEFRYEDSVLPYSFYVFENGYGFGYTMKLISSYDTLIKISP